MSKYVLMTPELQGKVCEKTVFNVIAPTYIDERRG